MPTPRGTTIAGGQVWTLMQGLFLRGHETPRNKSNNCPKSDLRPRLGMDMHAPRFETLWDSVSTSTSFLVIDQRWITYVKKKKKGNVPLSRHAHSVAIGSYMASSLCSGCNDHRCVVQSSRKDELVLSCPAGVKGQPSLVLGLPSLEQGQNQT
jgi:hypothetical protein